MADARTTPIRVHESITVQNRPAEKSKVEGHDLGHTSAGEYEQYRIPADKYQPMHWIWFVGLALFLIIISTFIISMVGLHHVLYMDKKMTSLMADMTMLQEDIDACKRG